MTILVLKKLARQWNPAWDGGSCTGHTDVDFFPSLYNDDADVIVPSEIVQLCEMCSVKAKCLEWAMNHDAYGFWAGTSRYQRLQLGRDRHRVRCPGCTSESVTTTARGEICLACGISWCV